VFVRNVGRLLTHRVLLRDVWGPGYQAESQYLHVHVSHLRAKLEPDRARPRYIITAPGVGYRMVIPEGARGEPCDLPSSDDL
jgi:two-component system KDP operon response regulator KdpE